MSTNESTTVCPIVDELEAAASEESAKGRSQPELLTVYAEVSLAIRKRARLHVRNCARCQEALSKAPEAA